ncbi:MAG: hypothetical protein HGA65_02290, partial [Oscillochloris sp.]|nr:hypothetical protein [Oscillochloris sp.]
MHSLHPPQRNPSIRYFDTIRGQLVLGLGLIVLLMLVSTVIIFIGQQAVMSQINTTLEHAAAERDLSLQVQNAFLLARQSEGEFISSWRTIGFEDAQPLVEDNRQHLLAARALLDQIDQTPSGRANDHDARLLAATARLRPLLDSYEQTFQATVESVRQRGRADGIESQLRASLSRLEQRTRDLPDPAAHILVLQIRSDSQAYLAS